MGRKRKHGGYLNLPNDTQFNRFSFGGGIKKKKKSKRQVREKQDSMFLMRAQQGVPHSDVRNLTEQLKKLTKQGWQPKPNSRMNTMSDFIKAPVPQRRDTFYSNFRQTMRSSDNQLAKYIDKPYQTNYRTGKLIPLNGSNEDTFREWMGQGRNPILNEVAEYAGGPTST